MTQQELLRDFTAEFKRRDVLVALNARQHTDEEGAHIEKELLRTQGRLAVLSSDPRLPVAELADHPNLPFCLLKEQLLQGHGWLNPSLPLHLVTDPLLSAAGTPCQVLAGLLMHFRLNLPIEAELLHWEVLCDVSTAGAIFARTHHVGPTDEQFAALAPWSDLARALYQAWLDELIDS